MTEQVPHLVLMQRVRNRIIEVLELTSSFEEQLAYEKAVQIAYVPDEVIEQWGDWVNAHTLKDFTHPVFSVDEATAINLFNDMSNEIIKDIPKPTPDLATLQRSEPWLHLRQAAMACLDVMNRRGRFPEDVQLNVWP